MPDKKDEPKPVTHETKAEHEFRCKEFFVRGRPIKLSDHTEGTFIKWGKMKGTAIILNEDGLQTSVTKASLVADNLPRKVDSRATR